MHRTPKLRWIVGLAISLVVLLTASQLLAKQGIIKTKDGRTITGDVTETTAGYSVVVRGISTTILRDNVDSVQYVGGIEEQYQERLSKLPKNATAADHVAIARWLFDNHSYDLALSEAAAAERIDPNNTDASTLEQTIQSQKRLEHPRPVAVDPRLPKPPTTTAGTGTGTVRVTDNGHTATDHHFITADDINTLRQVEWPKDDTSVRATVAADVRKKYLALAGEKAGAFNGLAPAEQARIILESDVKELRKDVKILNDPAPLVEFRRTIEPMILKGCAAAGCHGGPQGGKFFLYNPVENDAGVYTNFYLLTQGGMNVEGAEHLLIDRTYPDSSLLAELGLPPEISKVKHKPVNGAPIRAMFKGKDDPQYRMLINWMGKSLVLLPGPTGISFSLDDRSRNTPPPVKP